MRLNRRQGTVRVTRKRTCERHLVGVPPAVFAGNTDPPKSEVEAGAGGGKEPVDPGLVLDMSRSMMDHL